jgi:WD40 repeat protein
MGIVYLAEQRTPIRRRVALKVLKHCDDHSSFIRRFESESQVLAMMDHPNIARVFDAGVTAEGRPYFAMEYVAGIPITDYCDKNLLGFRDRLVLFQQVCLAVQHAHQKGIIHRDLKPSNVLVVVQDGKPVPKVIDFGVSKATNQRLTEMTLFTEIGMLIGTPEYMSPEQADHTGLDIDSTTDVYSLGVLLYELLVGSLPFDTKTLRKAGYAEILRLIREEEPPKLTTRLNSMGGGAQEIARRRRSDVGTLVRLVRGDLEWITTKALEKDRTRRYASASELAADIGRHMAHEPVTAGRPETVYRLRKFIRRHKGPVAAGAVVAIAVLAGTAVSFALYLRAKQAQQRLEIETYAANLSAADLHLRAGQAGEAISLLTAAPAFLRGWEWRYLAARSDESAASIYSPEFSGVETHRRFPEMRFGEEGAQLFSYGDAYVRSWDVHSKRLATDLSGLGRVLAIGPQGKTVLTGPPLAIAADPPSEGFVLRLYNVSTRRELAAFKGLDNNAGASAISNDGEMVVAAGDFSGPVPPGPTSAIVWDSRTAEIRARLEHPDGVTKIRFGPDGRLIASASAGAVHLWSLPGGGKRASLQHDGIVDAIAFSSDGRLLASGSRPGTVSIWDTTTGRLIRQWNAGCTSFILAAAFSPDSARVATSCGNVLRLWDPATGQLHKEYINGQGLVTVLAFHPTEPRLYSGNYGVIKEWDLGRQEPIFDEAPSPVWAHAISPDGRYIASGLRDGTMRIHDLETRKFLRVLTGNRGRATAIAFSPDSALVASASFDKTVRVWNASDGRLVDTLAGHTDLVWSVAFFPDGRRIASGSDDSTIRVWMVGSGAPPVTVAATSNIRGVAVTPDGSTILGLLGSDNSIGLWNAQTMQQIGVLSTGTVEESPAWDRSMALSKNGQVLIAPAESGRSLAIWDLPKRKLKQIVPVFDGWVDSIRSLAISPDGTRVAIGRTNSGGLSIWDLQNVRRVASLSGHTASVRSLSWTSDGTRLISASTDKTIRVWDARSVHDQEAEFLLDKMSERCLLVEEMVQELENQTGIGPELRKRAIELAHRRGDASYVDLVLKAWNVGTSADRTKREYLQALRRATVGAAVAPWYGDGQLTLALLYYRTGDYGKALSLAQRAIDIRKATAPNAHNIRAMAYVRMNNPDSARKEMLLVQQARHAADPSEYTDDRLLRREAESLVPRQVR